MSYTNKNFLDHVVTPKIALISKVTDSNIFLGFYSLIAIVTKYKKEKKEKVKESIKVPKYDCFHVTLKTTPLLAR